MNRDYLKPALTYDEQIKHLKASGLIINDSVRATEILRATNYYRLSAYMLGLINEDGEYIEGSTIEKVYNIYLFDEELRHLLFQTIEPIELKLRAEIAYQLGTSYGNAAHLNPDLTKDKKAHMRFMSQYYSGLSQSFSLKFVHHNILKYGELPIWAAVETLTFGVLSKYYGNLKTSIQGPIAKCFYTDIERLPGWLESLCEIRNICAHSNRLYNAILKKCPKLYSGEYGTSLAELKNKILPRLVILKKLYNGNNQWRAFFQKLINLVDKYKNDINLWHFGLLEDWITEIDKLPPNSKT